MVGLIAAIIIQVRIGLRPLFALRREVAEVRKGAPTASPAAIPANWRPWPRSSTPCWPITRRWSSASAPMSATWPTP